MFISLLGTILQNHNICVIYIIICCCMLHVVLSQMYSYGVAGCLKPTDVNVVLISVFSEQFSLKMM